MELVERSGLLSGLEVQIRQAETAGRMVLIGGEAGVGKTSLARSLVERSPGGVRVLWGACDPLSTPRPLAPFHDMPPLGPVLAEATPREELLSALLAELATRSLMVVEDVHWADEATLDALRFLGRRVTGTPSVVLVTFREDEVGSGHPLRAVLGDLATAAGCERMQVPPLSAEGVRTLAAGQAIDPDRLYRATRGNAFYVTEVLAAPGWSVPLSVTDAVLARVSRLSADARALIDLVSIAPGGLEPELAERISRQPHEALDEAVERGVLVATGARLEFRHELARIAVESAVPAGRARMLHGELLAGLEARGADLARLVHHADAAGLGERVLRYAPDAAREASARGAHREAARQLERAVGYADALTPKELGDLLTQLAEERVGFDPPPERLALLERIAALRRRSGDDRGLGETLVYLSLTTWGTGRSAEAYELALQAVEILERLPGGRELAHAYATVAVQHMLARRGEPAVEWGTKAIELAEAVDAHVALHLALNAVGTARLVSLDDESGVEFLERSAAFGAETGDHFAVGRALGNLGSTLGELRRYDEASARLERAIAFDEEHDLDGLAGYATAWLARVRFEQGRWEQAEELATEALRRRDVLVIIPITALCVLGRLAVRRGVAYGAVLLDEAWALAETTGDLQRVWPVAAGRAEAAWLTGRSREIERLVRPTFELARSLGSGWSIGELGWWLARAGTSDVDLTGAAEPFALAAHGGWREAAEAWARLGCPYERAEALALGDEPALREALAILTGLGAEPMADRVREAMRRAGVKRVPARPRASTREAPAQLTRRQLEVLGLLGDGLGNAEIARRLFISEKTVIHHVSAILRKFGARTRGEAAAVARKMGIEPIER
ncbi:MAG TPA: LuxR C-terminal-related transcriptional regulator [Gaiellaceae bacterium]|nr:LuxR C-terminal-related transcriptional regulator [Gaiellaceae bacterium]